MQIFKRIFYSPIVRSCLILVSALLALWIIFKTIGFDPGYATVILIGGGVGAVELLGRYLYAPLRAVLTGSGACYVLVNMAAAAAAYYMIGPRGFDIFGQAGAVSQLELPRLKAILLAGFGALAFMRSSLFKFRVGANDIGIGPAAILDTLLLVADRGVDRQEAILRAREVTNLLSGADPVKGAKILASYCLALMQNVTADERKSVLDSVKRIASEEEYDKDIRLDLIALELTKIVGPTVLEAAVVALGNRLSPLRASEGSVAPAPVAAPPPGPPPGPKQPPASTSIPPLSSGGEAGASPPTAAEIRAAIDQGQGGPPTTGKTP